MRLRASQGSGSLFPEEKEGLEGALRWLWREGGSHQTHIPVLGLSLLAQKGLQSPACHPSLLISFFKFSSQIQGLGWEWGLNLEEKINSKEVERVKRRIEGGL